MTPPLEAVIAARPSDLGDGFMVRRALPSATRRAVGPFVFFDEMGPVTFEPGKGLDVRPHPHIGLATVTYLFEGEIVHRDSLGTVLPIRPGEVNWMTAGRGIVHSERTSSQLRQSGSRLCGLQVWVALPQEHEDTEPAFAHHDAHELPQREVAGARLRIILGDVYGVRSPVKVFSRMFYVDAALDAASELAVPDDHEERAAYVIDGSVRVNGTDEVFGPSSLLVFTPVQRVTLTAAAKARIAVFGGDALDGPRFVWWNFVSSSKARIEQAKAEWASQAFPAVPGETEFIPLPAPKRDEVSYP